MWSLSNLLVFFSSDNGATIAYLSFLDKSYTSKTFLLFDMSIVLDVVVAFTLQRIFMEGLMAGDVFFREVFLDASFFKVGAGAKVGARIGVGATN